MKMLENKTKMMRPEFDHDEEYIVAYYRRYGRLGGGNVMLQDVTVVAVGAVFFGLGYFKDDIAWLIIGFGIVVYLALRGVISGYRYNRILASVIEKYECMLKADRKDADAEDVPPTA